MTINRSFSRFSLSFLAVTVFLVIGTCLHLSRLYAEDFVLYPQYKGKKISKVQFEGLRNTDPDDLLDILENNGIEVGALYNDISLNKAAKAVVDETSVYYLRVTANLDSKSKVILTFICKERPIVDEIDFVGTEELSDAELRDAILIKEGNVLKERELQQSKKIIIDKYLEQGMFLSSVNVIRKYNKKDNTVDIIFKIDEGENVVVTKIEILGTNELDPDDLIDVMETEEDGWFTDGSFNRLTYEEDRDKIVNAMRKEGFRDAEIVSDIEDEIQYAWKDEAKTEREIHLTLRVKEGKKYFFNKYEVHVVEPYGKKPLFRNDEFFDYFELTEPGEIFDYEKFTRDRQSIQQMYSNEGHIFARVVPTEIYNDKDVTIRYPGRFHSET